MKLKLIEKKCSFCEIIYQGRSYQEFCGTSCSDKSYYWHKKRGLKRKTAQIRCDVCNKFFHPLRNNTKRCSRVCRTKWVRNFSHERYTAIKKRLIEKAPTRNCSVCEKPFKLTSSRQINCSKKCSTIYTSYSAKKRRVRLRKFDYLCGRPYEAVFIPLPDQRSIPVGKINLDSSVDLQSAVKKFLEGGGEIRKYDASVVTDLLEDHPLSFDELNNADVQEQLFGTVKAK